MFWIFLLLMVYVVVLALMKRGQDQMKKPEPQNPAARVETDRIAEAIHKLKRPDKIGVAGMGLGTGAGVAGGTAAAGVLASAAGATTLLGSTTLASALGGIFVAATPIGWIVGCGIAGGALGLGIAKLIKSGGAQDQIREDMIKRFQTKLDTLQRSQRSEGKQCNLGDLKTALSAAMKNNSISEDQAARLVKLVSDGKLQAKVALDRLNAISSTSAAVIK
jgi:hypothetical protein